MRSEWSSSCSLLVFSGVWLWAWLPYHKKAFDALARLPMRAARSTNERGHQR